MAEHYRKAGVPQGVIDAQLPGIKSGPAVGTPEQILERLSALQDLGMTYAITYFLESAYDLSGVELFEAEVLPHLLDLEREEHHERRWHLPHRR